MGSKLGEREDIQERKQLAVGTINKIEAILKRNGIVNTKKKMKLYGASFKSILLYNCATLGDVADGL